MVGLYEPEKYCDGILLPPFNIEKTLFEIENINIKLLKENEELKATNYALFNNNNNNINKTLMTLEFKQNMEINIEQDLSQSFEKIQRT